MLLIKLSSYSIMKIKLEIKLVNQFLIKNKVKQRRSKQDKVDGNVYFTWEPNNFFAPCPFHCQKSQPEILTSKEILAYDLFHV